MIEAKIFKFCNIDPKIIISLNLGGQRIYSELELNISARRFDSDDIINSNDCIFQFLKFDIIGAITSVSHEMFSPVLTITILPLQILYNWRNIE